MGFKPTTTYDAHIGAIARAIQLQTFFSCALLHLIGLLILSLLLSWRPKIKKIVLIVVLNARRLHRHCAHTSRQRGSLDLKLGGLIGLS